MPLVLVVEDDLPMQHFLTTLLGSHELRSVVAGNGREALAQARTRAPDVILLDLGLPDTDGLEVTRELRTWTDTPIIVLSARGREQDKIDALDLGADDYLTKPFGGGELLARIRVALRHRARVAGEPTPVFEAGGLRVDLARREVRRDGVVLSLTPTEYKLLELFVQHAGRVLTHAQILKAVWGPYSVTHTHYVRVHVHQLRKKIERDPNRPRLLVTETGVGYRLKDA